MKAHRVVFAAPRKVEIEEIEIGEPGPGQALLRADRTLISTGTELTVLSGDFPPNTRWAEWAKYPFGTGYSNAATIAAVGEGVTRVVVGDRVVSTAPHASLALSAAEHLYVVPDDVDPEAGAFATLAEIVMGGVRRSRLMFGESAVIIGAGLLGQLAACFCRAGGAWPVIVIDPEEHRLPTALRMGATHALAATADAAVEEVARLTKERMADIVFEVTGNPLAMVGAVRLSRKLGRVILLGSPRGPVTIDLHEEAHTLGLEIIGAHNQTHPPVETSHNPWTIARHVELFLAWQAAGVVDVRPLITHRYPWREAPAAYEMLLQDRGQALGVILDWSEE